VFATMLSISIPARLEEVNMKLVKVKTFYDSPSAWIALNQLNSEGIKAFMENEMLVQNAWGLGEAAGQIRLVVAENDVEKACRILEEGSTLDLTELDELAMESKPVDESKPLFKNFYPPEDLEDEELRNGESGTDRTDMYEGLADADEEDACNARELLIDRTLRGSIVSFFFFPLAFLVAYQLFQIFLQEEPIRPKYRKKLFQAYAFHLPVFVISLFLIRFILQPM
jgi:hypothetical protein